MRFAKLLLPAALAAFAGQLPAAALFPQCPAIGDNTGCAVLITIAADGSITTAIDATQGPYDGAEDTLIGVQNNSSSTVGSVNISGSDIFGFDGDGICTFAPFAGSGYCSAAQTGGTDPDDYQGPTSTFTITDVDTGTVVFNPGIASGAAAFFSLEEPPTANLVVTPGPPLTGTPEPASLGMMGLGVMGVLLAARRRRLAR